MRKKLVLLLSFLALMASPHLRAQVDLEGFDQNVAESTDLESEDLDFGDEEISESDFAEAESESSSEESSEVVEAIPPADDAPASPAFAEEEPASPAPMIPETDTPPTNMVMADGVAFGDEPDLEYEAQLFDIYLNFHSKPISEGDWNKMLSERTVENYRIQKGDNLWGISSTIFGDGNYWPKIWSINSGIRNPHLIEPGNTIKFILGDESGPPAFTVAEAEETSEAGTPESNEPTMSAEPDIPPPTINSRPVVRRLPPSLPQWQDPQSINSNFDNVGFEYKRRKIADIVDQLPLSSYVSEEPPEALGVVQEVETGNRIASSLQYVYVTVKGEGDVGDTFLAVMNRGEVTKTTSLIKDRFLGYGIEVLGEIQLVEKVNGENERKRGALYRALVTKIVNPVQVGSVLIKGKIEHIDLSETNSKSQLVAQIVGGQLFNQRQVYGPESIAYLNKGSNAGLEVGQMLPIRAYRKLRNEKSMVTGNIRAIGWLKIIKTTPRFATAIVVRAWSDILTGDLTGAGEMSSLSLAPDNDISDAKQTSLLQELDSGDGSSSSGNGDSEVDFSDDEEIDEADFE